MADRASALLDRYGGATNAVSDRATRFLEAASIAGGAFQGVNAPIDIREPPPGIERFAREGVPLDVTTGAPFWKRAGLSFQPTEPEQIDYLRRTYQGAAIEQADNNFIIRNVLDPQTGKSKDLLVDENEPAWKDIADFANVAPQIALEAVFLKGLGRIKGVANLGRVGRVAAESATATLGSQTAAALGDVASRAGETPPPEDNIFTRRFGTEAALSFGLGAGLGGAVEAAAFARDASKGRMTGLLTPGNTERQGIAALANIEQQTGITINPSLGMIARDPNVMRLESFMAKIPFFGRAFENMRLARENQVRQLQLKLMDNTPYTPLSELGAETADVIRTAVREPQAVAQFAETSLANRAADEMENAITRMAPAAVKLTPETAADLSKFAIAGRHNEFRKVADDLFTAAGNPDIPTKPLDNLLADIEKKLPKEKVEIAPDATLESILSDFEGEVQSFITDAAGKPIVSEAGQRINRDLVPASLTKLIRGLRKLGDTVPLEQLRTVRNTIDSAIKEGRGLEGLTTFQLKQLSHAVTETIEQGVETMGDQAAATALKRANAFYKENIEQFEVPIIARMLKGKASQPGFIHSLDFMDHLRANQGEMRQVEQFMKGALTEGGKAIGATANPTFNMLRRSILEDIFRRSSRSPGAGRYIDAKAFADDLGKFKPEIQASLLGTEQQVVERNLNLLRQLKEGFEDVPIDDLNAFLRNPVNSVHDASRLATARKRERELFENEVVQKLFKGDPVDILNPRSGLRFDQTLDWLMNAKNEADVTRFMALLGESPETVRRLRANAVADFFQEVAQKSRVSEAGLRDTSHLVNPQKLITAIRDPEKSRRLRIVLGQDQFNVLDWFATAQTVLGKEAAQTLIGSNTSINILKDLSLLVRNVPDTVKFVIYSRILTDSKLRQMIQRGALEKATDVRSITRAMVMSPPMLDALAEEYGKTGVEMVLSGLQDVIGGIRNEEGLQMQRDGRQVPMQLEAGR